jgi:hypothetical protein
LSSGETFTVVVTEGNAPPLLATIGNKAVSEAALLSFTISATDSDLPAQTLTYSLDAGAPAGASFNPATRTFNWMPTEAQGPGNNTVTFRVTDNGSPAQSDFEAVTLQVNEVNAAPGLAGIADQTVTAGSLLTVTNSATDADIPSNTLTYSLDPGAPVGASIDPNTGVFTWTPSTNQAPSTNTVTVRVIDSGSPPLADTRSFTIAVTLSAPLRFTSVTVAQSGSVTLTWSSETGRTYRLGYKNSLNDSPWTAAGDFTASSTSTAATNDASGSTERYYRLELLNP